MHLRLGPQVEALPRPDDRARRRRFETLGHDASLALLFRLRRPSELVHRVEVRWEFHDRGSDRRLDQCAERGTAGSPPGSLQELHDRRLSCMALLGGLGGGITRDVLVNQVPGAITNPAYITLSLVFGVVGYHLAFAEGQLFREGLFQFMTSFSLAWYAIAGAEKGVTVGLPVLGTLLLALVGRPPAAGWIDVSSGVSRSSSSAASGSSRSRC